MIIILSGSARSGKDTTGKFIKEYLEKNGKRVISIGFGDYLKFIASRYFGYKGDEYKEEPEQRHLLQFLGTEIGRKNNPDIWANVVSMFLKGFSSLFDVAIVTDMRFPNEYEVLKKDFEVITVKICRKDFDNKLGELNLHKSETSLNDFKFDYYINNDASLDELREKVNLFMETLEPV